MIVTYSRELICQSAVCDKYVEDKKINTFSMEEYVRIIERNQCHDKYTFESNLEHYDNDNE